MEIHKADRRVIESEQPQLAITSHGDDFLITGIFHFWAAYDENESSYIINPSDRDCKRLICIRDDYEVEILLPSKENGFPRVKETGGRIRAVAERHKLPPQDVHQYEDNRLCIIGFLDQTKFAVSDFLRIPLLQFFYDQSYFSRYRRWPRGYYAHGVIGLLENYFDRTESGRSEKVYKQCTHYLEDELLVSKATDEVKTLLEHRNNIQGHMSCLCGSKRKFRNCHEKAFRGLWQLHQYRHNK